MSCCGRKSRADSGVLGGDAFRDDEGRRREAERNYSAGPNRYDLIIDIAGNSTLTRLRHALTARGTLVIGGENGGPVTGGIGRQIRALAISPLVSQRLTMHATKERASDLEPLTDLIESGQLTSTLQRTYSLDNVPAAMRQLQAGTVRGKLAIAP